MIFDNSCTNTNIPTFKALYCNILFFVVIHSFSNIFSNIFFKFFNSLGTIYKFKLNYLFTAYYQNHNMVIYTSVGNFDFL